MLAVYITLMICTMAPVVALQTGANLSILVWLVFALVIVKAVLLVDHFMEMKHAPLGWRLAAQGWAVVVVAVLAGVHGLQL
ncbi:cytochrome C oxidase subunit IV family protein [Marinobacter daepoensis]|uniref:cytochrome C oxidase subunit IV family protein n=1 Tax=Marinobacter daepoensis TaxID=262077 RepID=UPI00041509A1|nr:cytochrome C oxidase subunit IV family protein [Marinobacter daepoensis]MBY6033176.1 cytochrome C oxidase subunit IV family protein [Marinobacter daepoensis]